jgi:hypothetical protein
MGVSLWSLQVSVKKIKTIIMKNVFMFIFTLLISFGYSQCNQYFIYESFSTALPTQQGTWINTSVLYGTTAATARTGANYLTFNALNDAIRLPQVSNPGVLTFYYRRSSTSTGTPKFSVETSPNGTTWTERLAVTTFSTTYALASVDIGALGLTNVHIRIIDKRASGTAERYIDNLGLTSTVSSENTLIPFLSSCSSTLNSSFTYSICDDTGPQGTGLGGYTNSISRTVTLTPSDNTKKLRLTFSHLDLETSYDYLYVYDGANTSATLLATLNGTTTPSTITAVNASGQLTLLWTTDVSNVGVWGGFLATVTSISPPVPSCISSPTTPTNGATNVSLETQIAWPAATDASTYDVYFGTTLPGTPTTNTSSTSYLPGTLLANTTYYWKIVPKNSVGASPSGCATWSFTTFTPPSNDNPSGATQLTVNSSITYSTYTNLYSTNTTTESTPSCASYTGEDVWFKVTVPPWNVNTLEFDAQTGDITDGGMTIYRGTIGSLTEIECDDDDSPNGLMPYITRSDFVANETIYIRFWEYGGGTTGTFKLSVSTNQPLPVELTLFDGIPYPLFNVIKWTTASEHNSSYFDLENSFDGENWKMISKVKSAGNSTTEQKYSFIDYNQHPLSYYRLQQYDIDGQFKTYGPIVVTKSVGDKKVVKYINLLGQEINPDETSGVVIEIYEDGSIRKMIR